MATAELYDKAGLSGDQATADALQYRRRLPDKILVAFHHACDERDTVIAGQLLETLECLISGRVMYPKQDRRKTIESLVGAHSRLWHLKDSAKKRLADAGN